MNKKFIKTAFAVAIAMIAGVNVFNAQKTVVLSDVAMANVEALANGEWENGQEIDCMRLIISPSPDSLGSTVFPIVVDCEPCGNLVVATKATGKSTCIYYKINL